MQVTLQEFPQTSQDVCGSRPWKLIATEVPSVWRSRMKTQITRLSLLVSCDWYDPCFRATAAGQRHCKGLRQVHTSAYWAAWTELSLPGWQLILLPLQPFRSTRHCFASGEWVKQLCPVGSSAAFCIIGTLTVPCSLRETDAALCVFPATSLCSLLPPLLICHGLVVRFVPHLMRNSSISCCSECTFFFCIHKEICFEVETFSALSLIVHNQGSFLALQEGLHRAALSTGQWKQKCFYHNALCLGRKWEKLHQECKKMQRKAKTYCHKLFVCRGSHQMSAQPVLSVLQNPCKPGNM